jgi:hypothetical protein
MEAKIQKVKLSVKKIKRDLAYDKFGAVDSGKPKSKPKDSDKNKTKSASKKD